MAYLYLDESGSFRASKSLRSVIGGLFIKNDILTSQDIANFFSKFDLKSEYFHGKELSNLVLSNVISGIIDFCKDKEIIPVIFIPQRGFYVIDDSITYLNVLSDGIISFIKNYSNIFQNINELTITIEHRRGLTQFEYKERLSETIDKAIILSHLSNRIIKTNICIDNKKNYFLQLADAIVHTFYRLDVDYYSKEESMFDHDVERKFKDWIEPYKIYIHASKSPAAKIIDLMNKSLYEHAIKNMIDYSWKDDAVQRLIPDVVEQLCKLNIFYINNILASLFALYYNAVNEQRLLNEFEKDVEFIINEFLPRLQEMLPHYGKLKEDINWAYTYCYMILLTLYNHKGDVQKFEEVYRQAQTFISSTPFDLDSLSARLRIHVLYGVHLTNMYAFEQCFNEMAQLERKVSDAFTFLSESDDNLAVQPRILGEIRGTKLQAIMYHTLVNGGNWDKVREISDEAIDSFVQSGDIQRQYQYRAQIETYAKNFDEAKNYLAKGCGIEYENDIQLLEYIVGRSLIFPLFHFLRICYVDVMSDYTKNVKYYYEMIKGVFSKYDSNIEKMLNVSAYPVHTLYHYLMVLWYLYNSNTSRKEADEFYQKALELCKKEDNITMKTIELSLQADYIWMLSLHKPDDVGKLIESFNKSWDKVLQKSQQTLLYTYLSNAKEKYKTTHVNKWNTLWYIFPF